MILLNGRLMQCDGLHGRVHLNIVSAESVKPREPSPLKAKPIFYKEQKMPVLRKNKTHNYTVIDNHVFRNNDLSLKAKGLLCQMLSLPDDWDYSLEGLVALSSDGISSVRSALKELENQMYFKRRRLYRNGKLSGVEYIISEEPMCENLILENLKQENLIIEKEAQLNNNNNKIKKESNKKGMYADVPDYLADVFMEWADMRKKIKKPIPSEKSVKRALNKLYSLSADKSMQIKIVEQAIDKNWLSFWPLKEEVKEQKTKRYKDFEPEPEIDAVPMPEETRKAINKFYGGLSVE